MKRILILSANPQNTSRLRLDEEVSEINEGLLRSKYREQFIIHQKWAVRLRDLRRAMLDYEPQIVHFCGHGEQNGLIVEDEDRNATFVNPDALAGLFELFSNQIECVLLNACYSQIQADAICKYINYVIGMKKDIQDKAAIEFAVGFYDAVGAGKTYEEAFEFGRNAIQLYDIPEHLTPILKRNLISKMRIKPIGQTGHPETENNKIKKKKNEQQQKVNIHIGRDVVGKITIDDHHKEVDYSISNVKAKKGDIKITAGGATILNGNVKEAKCLCREDILKLFQGMLTEIDGLEIPKGSKHKAKKPLKRAIIELEDEEMQDKQSIAEFLKKSTKVLKEACITEKQAVVFGQLMIKAADWLGKTMDWFGL